MSVQAEVMMKCNAVSSPVNKHKPWIETSYHGVITENMDTVLLDPPLVALDKDAPVPFAEDVVFVSPSGIDLEETQKRCRAGA
ncbi:unnamed protein product [Boreogadus saida]